MNKKLLLGTLILTVAAAAQATLVYLEEFDGNGAGYNPIATTAMVGDNDWVDFANRMIATSIGAGGEGLATASGGTESVVTAASNGNDPQIRSDFEAGFDKTLVTNVTLRMRLDVNRNNTYDDPLVATDFNVFWGTDPYVNPGAANGNSQLNFNLNLAAAPTIVSEMNNGWHTLTWSFAAGTLTQGTTGDTVRSLRIDPANGPTLVGSSFEIDYLRVESIPEPGTALLLGVGGVLAFAARRRRAA